MPFIVKDNKLLSICCSLYLKCSYYSFLQLMYQQFSNIFVSGPLYALKNHGGLPNSFCLCGLYLINIYYIRFINIY